MNKRNLPRGKKNFLQKRVAEGSVLATLLTLTGCSGHFSALDPAGPHAEAVVGLWWGMLIGATIVTIGVCWLWWHAMRRDGSKTNEDSLQGKQNKWVIGGGIILPTVAITALLAFGIPAGHRMLPFDGDDVMIIEVEARLWYWNVYYPDLDLTLRDEVHIPVDTPVNFHITSADVIHSFWVPRLGGKVDAIPGRTNQLRLEASQVGQFGGQCAEYCGTGHTFMKFIVHAHSEEDFAEWRTQVSQSEGERVE